MGKDVKNLFRKQWRESEFYIYIYMPLRVSKNRMSFKIYNKDITVFSG